MQKFSVQEAFKFGWETFKKYPAFLIGIVLVSGAISYLPGMLLNSLTDYGRNPNPLLSLVITIPAYVAQLIVTMGMMRIAINLVEGKKPQWEDLYSQYPKIVNYFIGSLLFGLMVVVGLILLVVPGIYLGIKYYMYAYLIVDKNLGALDALKQSAKITQGSMWNLFLFGLVSIVLVIIGVLLFMVGLLVAAPVVTVAGAYVYKKLSA